MEIAPAGYVLIPLGLFIFFYSTTYLYYIFLFFVPFSASAVLNVNSVTFGLQIPYYFAMLWFIRVAIDRVAKNKLHVNAKVASMQLPLWLFWLVAVCITFTMPFVMDGDVLVRYPDAKVYLPLRFSFGNITQLMYLSFVVFVAFLVSTEVETTEKLRSSLRVLLYGAIVVSVWGLLEIIFFYSQIPYPYWLFNNSISLSQGYDQNIAGVVKRVGSVASEPSKFAGYLLWILPLYWGLWIEKGQGILGNKLDLKWFVALFVLVLMLSTSTAAYVGLAFMFIVSMFRYLNVRKVLFGWVASLKMAKTLTAVLLVVLSFSAVFYILVSVLGVGVSEVVAVIKYLTVEKQENLSGQERSEGFFHGLTILWESHLLGVGWGNNRTFDLGTTILSTTGILGGGMLGFFLIQNLRKLLKIYKSGLDSSARALAAGFSFSILTGFFGHLIADPDVIALIMWVILGLSISFIRINGDIGSRQ